MMHRAHGVKPAPCKREKPTQHAKEVAAHTGSHFAQRVGSFLQLDCALEGGRQLHDDDLC